MSKKGLHSELAKTRQPLHAIKKAGHRVRHPPEMPSRGHKEDRGVGVASL